MFDSIHSDDIKNKRSSKLRSFFSDKVIVISIVFSLTLNGLTWWLLYSEFHGQTEFVPLHYNIYFGIDLYGPWYNILLIPASALLMVFINCIFSYILYMRLRILSYFLVITFSLCQLIFLGAAWLITHELIV